MPAAIRASEMDRLSLFLTADERARVLAAYTLVDAASPDYAQTLRSVPGVAKEPVYTLNKTSADEIAWLNPVMAKALLAVSGLEQAMADPAKAAQMGQAGGFDLSRLPAGADLFALLGKSAGQPARADSARPCRSNSPRWVTRPCSRQP